MLLFASVTLTAAAQEEETLEKHSVATNSFWSNWFVQGGVDWNAWYGNVEDGRDYNKSPFKSFRSGPAASVAIGKWFTPGIGLRTKLQGIWGKAVFSDQNKGNHNKYWILNEQVLFNLSNLFCGYNPDRVYNLIPFAGVGVGRSCTYNRYAQGFSVGLLNEFNLSRKVALNLEIGWNRYESEVCGMPSDYGSGIMDHVNNAYVELGVTYNLGKAGWNRTPDVESIKALSQSQLDALNAQLADEQAENERLRSELENRKDTPSKAEKEYAATPVSVFFNVNSDKVASKKDLVNVRSLADYAKNSGAKLLVTGYADSATGNADYNRNLSQKRAERVAAELERMGVSKDNIRIEARGGVDTLVPPSYNRRATVEIVK